jgi:hypothetical protein
VKLSRPLLALAGLLLVAPRAHADPISLATWYTFSFPDAAGGFATAGVEGCTGAISCTLAGDPAWTFNAPSPVTVTIQDMQRSIDRFSLFDFGVLVGTTSAPGNDVQCNRVLEDCQASPDHSVGSFALGAGAHSLTIRVDLATVAGTSAFRVDRGAAVVPEPSTVVLLAGGLAALGGVAAGRRRSA